MDSRIESLDAKIRKLDTDLIRFKEQLARSPPGPGKESIKRQALQLLQQKKQYEQQRQLMMGQSFNLEQTNFTVESMRSTVDTVTVMKATAKDMKSQMRRMDMGKVEDLRDTIEDLMTETNEINEVLSRSYGTPEYLDEEDLEAELGMLMEYQEVEENPSYLDELPATSSGSKETATKSANPALSEPQGQ